jgi:Domain of unknown function (DUF4861)
MRKLLFILLVIGIIIETEAQNLEKEFPLSFRVKVMNSLHVRRQDVFLFIPTTQIPKGFNNRAFVVLDKGKEIASQFNNQDVDYNGIVTVVDELAANETRELVVRFAKSGEIKRTYTKRTQAELSHKTGGEWKAREYMGGQFKNVDYLRVPPEHKDHSWFIRYEGPGWESDKVGYRFYLDQRNATDVYGKLTSAMVLQQVGLDGFDSYHNMQSWGMDVMKVGKSLGVGSIGSMVNGKTTRVEKTDSVISRITENGNVYSSILTSYYGWKIGDKKHDLQSRISIHAGTRLSHQLLTLSDSPENISTGIVKDKNAVLLNSKGDDKNAGYIATYGKQSLNNGDELGLAVFFHSKDIIDFTEDEFSHIVKLKPAKGKLEYYFLGAWVLEPNGIKDQKQFEEYLKQIAFELANPVTVKVVK